MTEAATTNGRGRGGSSRGSNGRGRGQSRGGNSRGSTMPNQGGIPSGSVSKIKAQLRQTKRLLAREDLNSDVKITSERRLAALEDELVKAEKGLLEKKMVTKYRGVKFFERQKVLRRIKQAKKAAEGGDAKAKEQLFDARMDLYYILRYPKTEKYLALYPSNTYIPYTVSPVSFASLTSTSPTSAFTPSDPSTSKSTNGTELAESDLKRHALRTDVRKRVESGEWNEEPEVGDLDIEGEEGVAEGSGAGEKRSREDVEDVEESTREETTTNEQGGESGSAKKRKVEESRGQGEEGAETVESTEAAGDGPPKPLNRKQKKALKKAQEAAGIVAAPSSTGADKVEEDDAVDREDEEMGQDGEPKKLNRKQKKALRKAQEAAGIIPVAASPSTPSTTEKKTTGTKKVEKKKAVVEKGQPEKTVNLNKAEKLAQEDDFFA